jgi:hypothetical protein
VVVSARPRPTRPKPRRKGVYLEREVYAVLDGAPSKKIFTMIEPAGLVGLTWTGMGFRNLSNSKRSVNKLEDVSGLKVRVMANPVALETWKTIGANAVPMAFAEVFPALEIKALDGQENPLLHMYANKMQEVQKYISVTKIGLVTPPVGTVLNFVCGVAKIPMSGAIKGVMPFMIAQTIVMFLLVVFPQIVMWPLQMMTR